MKCTLCVHNCSSNFTATAQNQDYISFTNPRQFTNLPGMTIAAPVCASFSTIDEDKPPVLAEGTEYFFVTLTSVDSVVIPTDSSKAQVFILDNDGLFNYLFNLFFQVVV